MAGATTNKWKRQPFRLLTPAQACGRHCSQESLGPSREMIRSKKVTQVLKKRRQEVATMDGDFGLGASDLDVLGMSSQGVVPVAVGGGPTAAIAVVTRLASPVGSGMHRHAPAFAALLGAILTGVTTKDLGGVLAAVAVGGAMWLGDRVLEFQAQRLLPVASA